MNFNKKLRLLAALSLTLTVAACGGSDSEGGSASTSEKAAEDTGGAATTSADADKGSATSASSNDGTAAANGEKLQIAVVPGSTGYFFWGSLHAGAVDAGKEIGAEIIWRGTATQSDITGQLNILQDFVNQGVDGIAFAANDTQALGQVVSAAEAAKIPIVSADAGIDPQSIPLIATDNEAAAALAADFVGEKLGGEGQVALLPFLATSATSQAREKGFTDRIKEKYPNIEIVASQYTEGDVNNALNIMSDILRSNPDLDAVFGLNEPSVIGAMRAIDQAGADVLTIGFDNAPDEVAGLASGTLDALVVQDPYKIGYDAVMTLNEMIAGNEVPEFTDTGAVLVTSDNMNDPDVQKLLDPPIVE